MSKANQPLKSTDVFQIKHSLLLLSIVCFAGCFFAVLLYFYPGPAFLGNNFWPIFSLFAILAIGALLKMLFRKPILQIDHRGIEFFNSKIFIPWSRVRVAAFMAVDRDGESDNAKNFFVVQYLDEKRGEIMEIDFSITGMMDKSEADLEVALERFRPWKQ